MKQVYRASKDNVEILIREDQAGGVIVWVNQGFASLPLKPKEFRSLLWLMIKTAIRKGFSL